MVDSTSTNSLPEHLRAYLGQLRAQPQFRELLRLRPQTRLPTWSQSGDEGQEDTWKFKSGMINGETKFLIWLLGDDNA